jgi:uncharacterized protein (TIGR02996 family)
MGERDALLRAICDAPDDDLPRLVFADWLDEHGDPTRAEFIRLQCHLDASDRFAPGRRTLLCREWNLLRRHGDRWIREDRLGEGVWDGGLWGYPPSTRFRRGFVDRGWFNSPEEFARATPDLLTRSPVTGVSLWSPYTIPQDQLQWFSNTYDNIAFEIIRGRFGWPTRPIKQPGGTELPEPDEFRRLVASGTFARLRSFKMDSLYSDRRHLEILVAPAAPQLRELDLSGNPCVVGEAWAALVQGPGLAGLEALTLDGSRIGTEVLDVLVSSPHLKNVRRFGLSAGASRVPEALGPEGVRVVCGPGALPGLRELNLEGQEVGAEGLRTLAAWPGLHQLTRLGLTIGWREADHPAEITGAWAAFARSPHWGQLRELNLDIWNLEDLEAVLDSPNLGTLRVVTFTQEFSSVSAEGEIRSLQDEAAARLARCPHLADGVEVHLQEKGLTGRGRQLLRDRFGEGLVLYGGGGAVWQSGDWTSGRPPRATFFSEEPHPDRPPGDTD